MDTTQVGELFLRKTSRHPQSSDERAEMLQ